MSDPLPITPEQARALRSLEQGMRGSWEQLRQSVEECFRAKTAIQVLAGHVLKSGKNVLGFPRLKGEPLWCWERWLRFRDLAMRLSADGQKQCDVFFGRNNPSADVLALELFFVIARQKCEGCLQTQPGGDQEDGCFAMQVVNSVGLK